jgi:hypothetical protein
MNYPQGPTQGFTYGDGSVQGYGPRGPADDHLWAMLSYLLTFVASLLAPLIVYIAKMNESRYVRFHAAQSLNMGITGLIYALGGTVLGVVLALATHGFALFLLIPLFVVYVIAHLVYLILAAIAANRGELYKIPAVIALPIVR